MSTGVVQGINSCNRKPDYMRTLHMLEHSAAIGRLVETGSPKALLTEPQRTGVKLPCIDRERLRVVTRR